MIFQAVSFAPLISWPVLAGLTVLALAVVGLGIGRGVPGGWLRLLVVLVLLAALADPRLVDEQRTALPDVALVMVDQTLSQTIGNRPAQTEAALAEVRTRLARLPNLEVRVERVTSPPGADEGTRLFAAIERVLVELPRRRLAGLVMITDGKVHDVPADLGRSERNARILLSAENRGFPSLSG